MDTSEGSFNNIGDDEDSDNDRLIGDGEKVQQGLQSSDKYLHQEKAENISMDSENCWNIFCLSLYPAHSGRHCFKKR